MKPKLSDLFVENPVKTEEVSPGVEIEGSFQCQQCGFDSDTARMHEGKIYWDCVKCKYRSKVAGLG